MGDPDHLEAQTITQLSAVLTGGEAARERRLALLGSVVRLCAGAVALRQDGDRLSVGFADPAGAAGCAIALQQRIEADNRTAAEPGVLRIALAADEAGGDRLCALA